LEVLSNAIIDFNGYTTSMNKAIDESTPLFRKKLLFLVFAGGKTT
jgi:hypothetical protein